MKTEFQFNPDIEEMVSKHFPNWQEELKNAARNKLLDLLIAAFEAEKKEKVKPKPSK